MERDIVSLVEPDRVRREVYTDPALFDLEMTNAQAAYDYVLPVWVSRARLRAAVDDRLDTTSADRVGRGVQQGWPRNLRGHRGSRCGYRLAR
jgi:hypothetical protein